MRMSQRAILTAACVAGLWLGAARAAAQDDEIMMPEQSAAKAKQLLQEAIDALGGSTYLNVHDETCTFRLGQFDHSGSMTGFGKIMDYEEPPTKERTENLPKRNEIQIFNGDKGWVLDRGGVSNAPERDLADYQENTAIDLDNILRARMHEPSMVLRYAGPDIVDLHQADWVELVDNENRTIRIAIATGTHLPVRETVDTRDPRTQMKSAEIFYFSNYHPIGGIQTAFQVAHDRNGMKVYQAFVDNCEYNTGVSDSMFTKESLDERWEKIGKKAREKEKKEDEKEGSSSSK
jgi:hypothetical protein